MPEWNTVNQPLSLRAALDLALDWHNPDTREFVAKWGHGMSGREMASILREAAVAFDGGSARCAACDGDEGVRYCGWDKMWTCERDRCHHPERPLPRMTDEQAGAFFDARHDSKVRRGREGAR